MDDFRLSTIRHSGPALGGFLANPVAQYPQVFGNSAFLKEYPYCLPGFFAAMIAGFSAIAALFFLKEVCVQVNFSTRKVSLDDIFFQTRPPSMRNPRLSPSSASSSDEIPVRPSAWSAFTPMIRLIVLNYAFTVYLDIALLSLLPLFAYTPIAAGGLSFSPADIGKVMGLLGLLDVLVSLLIFPRLQAMVGTAVLFKCSNALLPFVFVGLPSLSYLARLGDSYGGVGKWGVWLGLGVLLTMHMCVHCLTMCRIALLLVLG